MKATTKKIRKIELTDDEAKLIGSIPSAAKAATIWAKFEERKIQAKQDRLALGNELAAVRDKLAAKGGKGLFERWLQVQGIPRYRAYDYIALAGHGKSRLKARNYKRRLSFLQFQTKLGKAETNQEKVTLLAELNAWVVKEYSIKTRGK